MVDKKFDLLNPASIFEDLFPLDPFRNRRSGNWMTQGLQTDIKETDNDFELSINVPGIKKENIDVTLENGYLTITAEQKEEQNDESTTYVRRERFYRSACRSFFVGEDVQQKDIKAKMENGVLTLTVPKTIEQKEEPTQKIAIE
ncbi:MAG TPA: hypothetical protein DCX17_01915 [Firmicutes bacterium]|nr:hypothetical protein [Bacillota bacterium]